MRRGFADLHNHQFSYLGFGGKAFHGRAFGAPEEALDDCTSVHGAGHTLDLMTNNIRMWVYGQRATQLPQLPHGMGNDGDSTYEGWPSFDTLSHQMMYQDWLFRALDGGMRLMVTFAVNNEGFAAAAANKGDAWIPDMLAVDRQIAEAHAMEAHVAATAQRPWYRIVASPAHARAVINAGHLAVVLGIEVDYLFSCKKENDLSVQQLDAKLNEYARQGIRHVFPIHFSDNGFGGTAWQNGSQYAKAPGPGFSLHWPWQSYEVDLEQAPGDGYGTGWRNKRGLTALGKKLVRGLVARGMLTDVDHASKHSKADMLDIAEELGAPVISGHTGFVSMCTGDKAHEGQLLDSEIERIRKTGGMVCPIAWQGSHDEIKTYPPGGTPVVEHGVGGSTETFAQAYLYAVKKMRGTPVGIGTDMNGMIPAPGPRRGNPQVLHPLTAGGSGSKKDDLTYTFHAAAADQKEMPRHTFRDRTFDFNTDGLAHVGLLPDMIADLQTIGLDEEQLEPLLRSAEGYVLAWQRAWSVRQGALVQIDLRTGTPAVWSKPNLPQITGDPAALASGANVRVYAFDGNGHLHEFFKEPNPAVWQNTDVTEKVVGGKQLVGAPSVVGAPGDISIFARGRDRCLYQMHHDGHNWSQLNLSGAVSGPTVELLDDSVLLNGDPSALINPAGDLTVFAASSEKQLSVFHRKASGRWRLYKPDTTDEGQTITGRPGAVVHSRHGLFVFAQGETEGKLLCLSRLDGLPQELAPNDNIVPTRPARHMPHPIQPSSVVKIKWTLHNLSDELRLPSPLVGSPSATINENDVTVHLHLLDEGIVKVSSSLARRTVWRRAPDPAGVAYTKLAVESPSALIANGQAHAFCQGSDGSLVEFYGQNAAVGSALRARRAQPGPGGAPLGGQPATIAHDGGITVFARAEA